MAKAVELRDQSVEELEATLLDLRKQLFQLVTEAKQSSKFEKAHRIPLTKKDIARVLTVLSEKQKANTQAQD